MTVTFTPATMSGSHARIALVGPSGSGKTLTALKLAAVLGDRVAVIDTEDDSAKLFAKSTGVPEHYDVINLTDARPSQYAEYISAAADQGYDVCIVDSITPSWYKILDAVGGNVLRWKDVGNPAYNKLIDALKGYRNTMHIIVTVRSKIELALEQDAVTQRLVVKSHGMQPIHRDGLQYEFDLVGALDQDHIISFGGVGKQRCEALDGKSFAKPGKELGLIILDWLQGGTKR